MPGRTTQIDPPATQDINMQDAPPSAQPANIEDTQMGDDAHSSGPEVGDGEEEEEIGAQRIKILPGSTDTAASFEIIDEGHTLGNALRYIIMKNPDVEFCAYAIPHPLEPKMNFRIQTYDGAAVDVLKKGLRDLQDVCDVVADEFWAKRQAFNSEQ